jgi:uncharacterized protein YyaL (SSP411 family)
MIKKILLMLLLVSGVFATDGIKWQKDYQSALKVAQKENKPVFFVSSRHTCKYCVVLEETTFQDPNVIKVLNESFVSVVSYSDEQDYMPRKLWRPGTPAMWFLMPDGTPMFEPLMGAFGARDMLSAFKQVKAEFNNKQKKVK